MEIIEKAKQIFKNLKHRVKPFYVRITVSIVKIIDGIHDFCLCGSVLSRERKVNVEGATAYEPTRYWALDLLFKDAKFTENDSFVDIGCGEGRVIAWLINKCFPGQITGIEKDHDLATIAKKMDETSPEREDKIHRG